MLYTFSQASYDTLQLTQYFQHLTEKDVIVLWQDGVLLPLKYPMLFKQLNTRVFILEPDLQARHLKTLIEPHESITVISLLEFVQLTERYFPQLAL